MATVLENLRSEVLTSENPQRIIDLENFFNIFDSLNTFEKRIVTECINANRPMNVNLYSRKDATDKVYANTEKNRLAYGVRTFNAVTETKNIIGTVNYIYENSVNNQQEREQGESSFEVGQRAWGVRITKSIVIHKGKIYLSVKFGYTENQKYTNENGIEISKNEFSSWEKASSKSSYLTEKAQNRQGVDDVIIVNDYCLDSITAIKINGELISR
jgi:hypothetical protein